MNRIANSITAATVLVLGASVPAAAQQNIVREVTRSPHLQQEIGETEQAFAALERVIRKGQQTGEFRDDVEPRFASFIFYGALEEILTGWVLGRLAGDEDEIREAERTVVGILCDGLVAR